MANKPKSFEEFYYSTEDDIFVIELVTKYVNLNNSSIDKYDRTIIRIQALIISNKKKYMRYAKI